MADIYKVTKVVTNNLVRASDANHNEVILTGKGIGHNKHKNDLIFSHNVEQIFTLHNKNDVRLYDELLTKTSPKLAEIVNECIIYIQSKFDRPLNEYIHISLTDHIAFLVRRYKMGIPIYNPFYYETSVLYPKETSVAADVVKILNNKLDIEINDNEVGFITLHIVSTLGSQSLEDLIKNNEIINTLIEIVETEIGEKLDKNNMAFARFITHVNFLLNRAVSNEYIDLPESLSEMIIHEYPKCYGLAWKLVKVIQRILNVEVCRSEISLLAIYLFGFGVRS